MYSYVRSSAPGKIILWGEHFVVYGRSAVVTTIQGRATAECWRRSKGTVVRSGPHWYFSDDARSEASGPAAAKMLGPLSLAVKSVVSDSGMKVPVEVRVRSDIPRGSGLGSSAAVSVATVHAVSTLLGLDDVEKMRRLAMEAEKLIHGRPSGIDTYASSLGGTIRYRGQADWAPVRVDWPLRILVVDTGRKRRTGEMVERVRSFAEAFPDVFEGLCSTYDALAEESLRGLVDRELDTLGRCMQVNQLLLEILGVSTPQITKAVDSALRAGALGSKLTGAGGGGCVIAIAEDDRLTALLRRIKPRFRRVWVAHCSQPGVRLEDAR